VLFEVAEDRLLESSAVCSKAMREVVRARGALVVGVEAGKTWADLEPVTL